MYGKNKSKQKKFRNQLQVGNFFLEFHVVKESFRKDSFFSQEIFPIASVQSTDPVTLILVDSPDESVLGCFIRVDYKKFKSPMNTL